MSARVVGSELGIVTAIDPNEAAKQALAVGARFGRVVLAPLLTLTSWQLKGAYSAGTGYVLNDVVIDSGIAYICIQAGTGHTPASSPTYWTVLSDDAPRLIAVIVACARKYPVDLVPAGLYNVHTSWSTNGVAGGMLSGTRLIGNGAQILQSMAWGGGHTECFIHCNPTLTATTTTVHTTVLSGEKTVVVDALIAVGTWIKINRVSPYHLRAAYYQVLGLSGAGPTYTLTLDRPILEAFPSNSVVTTVTAVPQDIFVSDLRITGTGERWIEMIAGRNVHVRDVVCDTSGGAIGNSALLASLDVGSYKSGFHRVSVLDDGTSGYCLTFETCEDCVFDHCVGIGAGIANAAFFDSHVCKIEGGEYSGGTTNGIVFDCDVAGGSDTFGNINCTIDGAVVAGVPGIGIKVDKGAQRTEVKNCKAIGCGICYSVSAGGTTYQCQDTQIIDCLADRPGTTGLITYATTTGTIVRNFISQSCVTDIDPRADIQIDGWVSRGNVGSGFGNNILVPNAANLKIRVTGLTAQVTAGRIGLDLLNSPTVWLTNCQLTTGASSTAVYVRAGCTCYVAGCESSGGAGSTGIEYAGSVLLDKLSSFTNATPTHQEPASGGTLTTETYA